MSLTTRIQEEYQERRASLKDKADVALQKGHAQVDINAVEKLEKVVGTVAVNVEAGHDLISFLKDKYSGSEGFYMGKSIYETILNIDVGNKAHLVELAHYGKHMMNKKNNKMNGEFEVGRLIYSLAVAKAFELGVYKELSNNSDGIIGKHRGSTWTARLKSESREFYTLPIFKESLKAGYESIGTQGKTSYQVKIKIQKAK